MDIIYKYKDSISLRDEIVLCNLNVIGKCNGRMIQ